jgi:membrane associated rhomboid family serine protease
MLPIRDLNPTRRRAVVTIAFIVINILVFALQFMMGEEALYSAYLQWAIVPARLIESFGLGSALTLITSMFMHGGFLHLASNMLYLYIFGDNIEDVMGHGLYIAFYLVCGVGAGLAQVFVAPTSTIPLLGASGAIAGVLGAYLVFYPKARIQSLVLLGIFSRMVELPATLVLGGWFLLQAFNGFLSFGMAATGGVAWFAHIGGFALGVLGAFVCKALGCGPRRPVVSAYRGADYLRDRYRR